MISFEMISRFRSSCIFFSGETLSERQRDLKKNAGAHLGKRTEDQTHNYIFIMKEWCLDIFQWLFTCLILSTASDDGAFHSGTSSFCLCLMFHFVCIFMSFL